MRTVTGTEIVDGYNAERRVIMGVCTLVCGRVLKETGQWEMIKVSGD